MNSAKRTLLVLWRIVPIILSFVRDFQRFIFWGSGRNLNDAQHHRRAKRLTDTLGDLGPTFIKLAQVLSARADVFPPTYIKQLSTLQDKVVPNPTADIKHVIHDELGHPVEDIFDEFDHESLAAASLGQVHRARYQGDKVVIKVLRPGVRELVEIDLNILNMVISVLIFFIGEENSILKSFMTAYSEFRRVIFQEMDFKREARNVKIFQHNLAHEEYVIIPTVYEALTTRRVLVLEYLQGVKINEVEHIEQMGIDIDLVIQRLAKIYTHQIMIDGFLHADPHPGNILVEEQGRIIILDFGMVVHLEASFKHHLIKASIAVARNDVDGIVNEAYELGIVEPGTNKAALRDLSELILEIQEQGKLSQQKVQQMINTFMEYFYEFPFTLPAELVYLARAVSLIEGIGFIHDPLFDLLSVARPAVREMAKKVLKEDLDGNILDILQRWVMRSYSAFISLQDVILKADREQFRVRIHQTDIESLNAIISSVLRKIILGMGAVLFGLVSSIVYLRDGNMMILSVGMVFSGVSLLIILLLPNRVPKVTRGTALRKQLDMYVTEDGEMYKSIVVSQMTREEREQMEAEREAKQHKTRRTE